MSGAVNKLERSENFDISSNLTMGIGGKVKSFIQINSVEELEIAHNNILKLESKYLVLGGGSNLVLSDNFYDGVVLFIKIKGIKEVCRKNGYAIIDVGAGEEWEDFVDFTLENCFWGVENLTLIPGTVGACPVQNVGAFGQEVKHIIEHVECYDTQTKESTIIQNSECGFSFRKSIFNSEQKGRYIITSVRFKLALEPNAKLSRAELAKLKTFSGTPQELQKEIRNTVRAYRTSGVNLPNNQNHGCSGTFFRTAVLDSYKDFFKVILCTGRNLGIRSAIMMILFCIKYRSSEGFRIPSKRLIQACELSNTKVGALFLLPTNPAVVVSELEHSPNSEDLVKIIDIVRGKVLSKTGVSLPIEPELIGFDM